MVRKLLTGNAAAAWGARLADIDYVPAFPITPQTEIIEKLAAWFDDGTIPGKFVMFDGEHSMLMAAGAAAAAGARVFTATSSQGLLYGMESLYTIAGWRVPLVIVNVSRGLSAPITLGPDHNDAMAARDSGCIQIHAATCQEALDSILMAYRIAEDERVRLPVLVNMDGFYLSFTREPVEIPTPEQARELLPPFEAGPGGFRASRPLAQGVAVLEGSVYSYFRYQLHLALTNAEIVYREAAAEMERLLGRSYEPVESYLLGDAEIVLVMAGSFSSKGKAAVEEQRKRGVRAGLLRPRLIRPWPAKSIAQLLAGKQAVAVLDQNISPGLGGVLYHELAAVLAGSEEKPPVLRSFIGGLGGKDVSESELECIFESLQAPDATDRFGEPELLMTEPEWQSVQSRLQTAGKLERRAS